MISTYRALYGWLAIMRRLFTQLRNHGNYLGRVLCFHVQAQFRRPRRSLVILEKAIVGLTPIDDDAALTRWAICGPT